MKLLKFLNVFLLALLAIAPARADEFANLARSLAAIVQSKEPPKIEPAKTEPAKVEPVKEPVKIEPPKIEPIKAGEIAKIPLDSKGNFIIKAFLLLHPITTLVRENVKEFGNTGMVSRLSFKNAEAILTAALTLFDLDSKEFLNQALDYNVSLLPKNDTTGEVKFFKESVDKLKNIIAKTVPGTDEQKKKAAKDLVATLTQDVMVNRILEPLFGLFAMGAWPAKTNPLDKAIIGIFFDNVKNVDAAAVGFATLFESLYLTKALVKESFFNIVANSWSSYKGMGTVPDKLKQLADILGGIKGKGKIALPVVDVSFKSLEDAEKEKKDLENEKKLLKEQLEIEKQQMEQIEKECRKRVLLRVLRDLYESLFVNPNSNLSPFYWDKLLGEIRSARRQGTDKGYSSSINLDGGKYAFALISNFDAELNVNYPVDQVEFGIENSRLAAPLFYKLMKTIAVEQKWLGDVCTVSDLQKVIPVQNVDKEYKKISKGISNLSSIENDKRLEGIKTALTDATTNFNKIFSEEDFINDLIARPIQDRYIKDFLSHLYDIFVNLDKGKKLAADWTLYAYNWDGLNYGEHDFNHSPFTLCDTLKNYAYMVDYFKYLNTILCSLLKDFDKRIETMEILADLNLFKAPVNTNPDLLKPLSGVPEIINKGCLAEWRWEKRAMRKAIQDMYSLIAYTFKSYFGNLKEDGTDEWKFLSAFEEMSMAPAKTMSLDLVESKLKGIDLDSPGGVKYALEGASGTLDGMLEDFKNIPKNKDWATYEFDFEQKKWKLSETGVGENSAFFGFKHLDAYWAMMDRIWKFFNLPLQKMGSLSEDFQKLIPK